MKMNKLENTQKVSNEFLLKLLHTLEYAQLELEDNTELSERLNTHCEQILTLLNKVLTNEELSQIEDELGYGKSVQVN